MNILVIGSGGREHAISWKLKQSKLLKNLFIAPGNAGTNNLGINVNIKVDDFVSIKSLVLKENISMVIVGPEDRKVDVKTHFGRGSGQYSAKFPGAGKS